MGMAGSFCGAPSAKKPVSKETYCTYFIGKRDLLSSEGDLRKGPGCRQSAGGAWLACAAPALALAPRPVLVPVYTYIIYV
jgi:hypothetical protein